MLTGALIVWYLLTFGSLVFVVWDQALHTPTGGVMKLAWALVILYTGPVGLFVYLLACRAPLPGQHDAYIAAHWKQSVGSLAHCLAGDATGIVIAAAIVYHFGLPNGLDLIVEYLAAFVIGLLVFQALFMKAMFGDYWLAVRRTFFAETVSMNLVMVGMFPVMLVLMHLLPEGDSPWNPAFWGIMSLATMAGGLTAYPINSWMVAKGFKHGMMSAPGTDKGGDMAGMKMPSMKMDDMQMDGMSSGAGGGAHAHHGAAPTFGLALWVSLWTFCAMLAAVAVTSLFVPLRF